jgi:hypothetical protein
MFKSIGLCNLFIANVADFRRLPAAQFGDFVCGSCHLPGLFAGLAKGG